MKSYAIAGLALASLSLCACAGLPLTGNPAADAKAAATNISTANSALGMFNQAMVQQLLLTCGADIDASVALPTPIPSGKVDFKCHIEPGQLKLVNGQIVASTAAAASTTLGLPSAAIGDPAVPVPTPAK